MKKRFLFLLLTIVSVFALTSCGKKYTVTFNSDGGTEVAAQEVKKGQTATKPEDPTKEGFTFKGWYDGSRAYKFSDKVSDNITLTAKWDVKKYTVKFDAEAGLAQITVNHGESLPANIQGYVPSKVGHTFKGWTVNGSTFDMSNAIKENITIVPVFELNAGVETITISFESEGGEEVQPIQVVKGESVGNLPTPNRTGFTFKGWTLNGELVTNETVLSENVTLVATWQQSTQQAKYKPNWEPNKRTGGWNGKNMTVKILVKPVSSYNPFDPAYSGTNTRIKQEHQRLVESAYGVRIVYEEWASQWGPSRITDITQSISDGSWDYKEEIDQTTGLEKGGVYVLTLASSWLPTLVKTSCLAELYNINTGTGIFAEVGYEEVEEDVYQAGTYQQNATINQIAGVNNVVYGYQQGNVHPDYFLYYNADLISNLGFDDPAELWFKGQWTWNTFVTYAQELDKVLGDGKDALAMNYTEFFIGSAGSTGNPIALTEPALNLCTTNTYNVLNNIKALYNAKVYAGHALDVPASFLDQNSVFTSGSLWFVNDSTRFDPAKCTFTIGAVPYPTAEQNGGTPITTTDDEDKNIIKGFDGEPLELSDGQYITGLDLSESSFQIPYTSTEVYSVVNFSNGKNGITPKHVFAILYDLNSGLGKDPQQFQITDDQAYRNVLTKKFKNTLHVDALMSVDKLTYFELIELLSMTVGNGSHYSGNGLWSADGGIQNIISKAEVTAADHLRAIEQDYVDAMRGMGYAI